MKSYQCIFSLNLPRIFQFCFIMVLLKIRDLTIVNNLSIFKEGYFHNYSIILLFEINLIFSFAIRNNIYGDHLGKVA